MSQTPRDEMVSLQQQIDVVNGRKSGWQRAWEEEKKRDPYAEKPPELVAFNKELGPLYTEKDELLKTYPELVAEFGGKKRKEKTTPTGFGFRTTLMQAGDKQRSARNAKKKDVDPQFWEFCGKHIPQYRQNMDSWENETIRSEYDAWCAEKEAQKKREAEREEREFLAAAKLAKETEAVLAELKQKELDAKCAEIPLAFSGDFLPYMGKSFKNQEALLKLWEDAECQGLYQLWLEDTQKKSSTA